MSIDNLLKGAVLSLGRLLLLPKNPFIGNELNILLLFLSKPIYRQPNAIPIGIVIPEENTVVRN